MTEDDRVHGGGVPVSGRNLWAYGYEIIPPHREDRMKAIRGLLERENGNAKREDRRWTGRLVSEEQITHLLIVSADPDLDFEINQKLESELKALGIEFHVSIPMPLAGGA